MPDLESDSDSDSDAEEGINALVHDLDSFQSELGSHQWNNPVKREENLFYVKDFMKTTRQNLKSLREKTLPPPREPPLFMKNDKFQSAKPNKQELMIKKSKRRERIERSDPFLKARKKRGKKERREAFMRYRKMDWEMDKKPRGYDYEIIEKMEDFESRIGDHGPSWTWYWDGLEKAQKKLEKRMAQPSDTRKKFGRREDEEESQD